MQNRKERQSEEMWFWYFYPMGCFMAYLNWNKVSCLTLPNVSLYCSKPCIITWLEKQWRFWLFTFPLYLWMDKLCRSWGDVVCSDRCTKALDYTRMSLFIIVEFYWKIVNLYVKKKSKKSCFPSSVQCKPLTLEILHFCSFGKNNKR